MTDTIASLRRKIDSAQDLQSVVRTMKALAASNIGQYENSVHALADYYRTVELGLGACFREVGLSLSRSVPTSRSPGTTVGAVVFGSDQGLVGRFNEVVAEFALESLVEMPVEPKVWAVGARVHARLAEEDLQLAEAFPVPESVNAIGGLVGEILVAVDAHSSAFSELHLFHNRPTVGAVYGAVTQRLLPLDEQWHREIVSVPWPTKAPPEVLGGDKATLQALIGEYLYISLFRACAESLASENASRLSAMQRADKNIDELLGELNGNFHRLRQSSIDEELFDVISGVEALSKAHASAAPRTNHHESGKRCVAVDLTNDTHSICTPPASGR